jgi:small subunit ribosomal protein S13
MVYLAETELQKNMSVRMALTNVYGIGKKTSELICKKMGILYDFKVKELTTDQTSKLVKIIELMKLQLASDLRKKTSNQIKLLVSIKTYRGMRRLKGLPVRGQRTHTNARTTRKIKI